MTGHRNILRWLAVLTAVVLLAAACGSDSGDASPFAPPNESGSSDSPGSDNDASPFAPSNESDSSEGAGSESTGSGLSPAAPSATNCADIQAAFESVGGAVAGSGSGASGDDLRASFDTFRAQLQALRSEAPEVSDDIDDALAGLDVLSSTYAEFDWDLSNLSDPQDAIALASVLTDGDVMGLFSAMANIGNWIGANCAG